MKTIAYFVSENIKTHQRFIYNQIVKITNYRTIVIGPFDNTDRTEFPFENYYNINKIKDLKKFFEEQDIIAIHAHHGSHGQEILPVCEKYNIPLIVSIRGRDGSDRPEIFKKNAKRYSALNKHGAHYYPVCQYLAEGLRRLGIPAKNMHVLYGGIELDLFPYANRTLPTVGEIRVLSVGRLVDKKGFVTLIKAFKHIYSQYPNARLHIIGAGEDEKRIKSTIAEYNLKDVVILRGAMDSKQVSDELKKAHIFCLASQTANNGDIEGIPNALKEAMASGLPVVSTRHAGIPELIEHQRTGYLAPEKNDMELAKGIQFFIENPDVWTDYTERARKVIEEKFDVNKQIIEQQRLYSLVNTVKTENATEKKTYTEMETETEKKTYTETETETEKKTKAESEKNTNTETETKKRTKAETEKKTNTETETKKRTKAESEKNTNTETETKKRTKAETEKKTNTETEKKTKAESEKKTNTQTEKKNKNKAESEKKTYTQTETEKKTKAESEKKTNTQTEKKTKTKAESEKNTETEKKNKNKAESEKKKEMKKKSKTEKSKKKK
ncbi:glycosyltransferase [Peribacillus frigoritolerans]|uniref:glycosyltransferase n=1 Tax=Peribacillus frigoritolerans TaxID=450367 RepID=UPI002E1AF723|nr:glycosyltransferase [Peribacillus frigoritolerans]MED3789854.1 glycosyltransferase [Peribacillus frigoritolerans]